MADKFLVVVFATLLCVGLSEAATACTLNTECSTACGGLYGVGGCVEGACRCVECMVSTDCHIRCLGAYCATANTCKCGQIGADQDRLVAALFERLDSQDRHIQTQAQILEKQQLRLGRQEGVIQDQRHTLKKQQVLLQRNVRESVKLRSIIRHQGVRIETQERVSQNLMSHLKQSDPTAAYVDKMAEHVVDGTHTTTKKSTDDEEGRIGRLTQRSTYRTAGVVTANSKRLVLGAEGPVAFHAVVDKKAEVPNIGANQNIIFDVVLENLGGGYHNQHGIFIAPVSGVYIFSVSILSYVSPHPEVQVDLKKDGVVLATAFAHGDNGREDQGSVSVVTNLTVGNEVWVSLNYPVGTSIYGGRFSTFMGCLVYPL